MGKKDVTGTIFASGFCFGVFGVVEAGQCLLTAPTE